MAQPHMADRRFAELRDAADALCASLPPLMIQAERTGHSVSQGEHGRRRVGVGEAFWQFRRFGEGDAAANIDWRQSAKSQNLYVRENEWEAAETIWCWCDRSPSMAYRSDRALSPKEDHALILLLAVAGLMLGAGERVGVLGSGATPQTGRTALSRLSEALVQADGQSDDDRGIPPTLPLARHSKLLLIGDFLAPPEDLAEIVRTYSAQGVQGFLLQVLDPAEEDFPFSGRVRFEDAEEEGTMVVGRAQSLQGAYRLRITQHKQALDAICRSAGWRYLHHRTDQPLQSALLTLYNCLSGGAETARL